jgi:Tol biopolymer transport system component
LVGTVAAAAAAAIAGVASPSACSGHASRRPLTNGRLVFASDRAGGSGSYAVDPSDRVVWELPRGIAGDQAASPDGKYILLWRGGNPLGYVEDVETGHRRTITVRGVYEDSWSPDGIHVVFRCGATAQSICVSGVDGRARVITAPTGDSIDEDPVVVAGR